MSSIYTNLPSDEYNFHLDIEGNQTKSKFTGDFTFKKPTLGIKCEISRSATRLGGDVAQQLDTESKNLNYALAWLRHTLINFPKWWQEYEYGEKLYDDNVISELLTKTLSLEKKWDEDLKALATHK